MYDIDFLCFHESNQIVCENHLSLGDTLRSVRISHGLTQGQLGEKLGYSPMTISNWENDLKVQL